MPLLAGVDSFLTRRLLPVPSVTPSCAARGPFELPVSVASPAAKLLYVLAGSAVVVAARTGFFHEVVVESPHFTPRSCVLSAVSTVPSAPTGIRLLAVSNPQISPLVVSGETRRASPPEEMG